MPSRSVMPLLLVLTIATLVAPAAASAREPRRVDFSLGGQPCTLIGVPAAAPVGIGQCSGVRPGAALQTETGLCSFNFMFRDHDGARYMGTAGHCAILDSPAAALPGSLPEEEHVYEAGSRPEVMDAEGQRVGEFVYAILSQAQEKDFALVRLDDDVDASPQMCHFGGPVGVNDDTPGLSELVVLHQYGQGLALGSVLPARSMVAFGMPSHEHVFAIGAVLPGDSGSGVISSDGRAVGVAVTTGVHSGGLGAAGIDTGLAGITRLTPQLERAEEMLATNLDLVTAPLL